MAPIAIIWLIERRLQTGGVRRCDETLDERIHEVLMHGEGRVGPAVEVLGNGGRDMVARVRGRRHTNAPRRTGIEVPPVRAVSFALVSLVEGPDYDCAADEGHAWTGRGLDFLIHCYLLDILACWAGTAVGHQTERLVLAFLVIFCLQVCQAGNSVCPSHGREWDFDASFAIS